MSMSPSVHFISKCMPDYTCFPTSGNCSQTVTVAPPKSLSGAYKHCSRVKLLSLRCASNKQSFESYANSNSNRRNPDFARSNKNGFSRSWNRQSGEKKGEPEESENLHASRNGPLLSFTGSKKSPATAAPGPREKEIIELFRKVQAQLRERAVVKEEKKVEESQTKNKESEHVDSLLRLLRKHSVQQKKDVVTANEEEFILEESKQFPPQKEEPKMVISESNNDIKQENKVLTRSRPKSNFQKRSPVPQISFHQPDNSAVSNTESSIEKKTALAVETDEIPEVESDHEIDVDPLFSEGNTFDEISELEVSEMYENEEYDIADQVNGMKLTELRALAKSRGLKGYTKLKKSQLIELLSE